MHVLQAKNFTNCKRRHRLKRVSSARKIHRIKLFDCALIWTFSELRDCCEQISVRFALRIILVCRCLSSPHSPIARKARLLNGSALDNVCFEAYGNHVVTLYI